MTKWYNQELLLTIIVGGILIGIIYTTIRDMLRKRRYKKNKKLKK